MCLLLCSSLFVCTLFWGLQEEERCCDYFLGRFKNCQNNMCSFFCFYFNFVKVNLVAILVLYKHALLEGAHYLAVRRLDVTLPGPGMRQAVIKSVHHFIFSYDSSHCAKCTEWDPGRVCACLR